MKSSETKLIKKKKKKKKALFGFLFHISCNIAS